MRLDVLQETQAQYFTLPGVSYALRSILCKRSISPGFAFSCRLSACLFAPSFL